MNNIFEYDIISIGEGLPKYDMKSELNELGKQGWELICIIGKYFSNGYDHHRCLFKRKIK